MCELFGFSSKEKICSNFLLKKFYSHSDKHPHGWGLACINKDEALIEKESKQASKSNYLKERLSQPVVAKLLLAHIRYATVGNIYYRNCHPYSIKDNYSRRWTLIHNGTIFDFPALNTYIKRQRGDTDSERVLLYIVDKINEAQTKKGSKLNFEERFALIDSIIYEMSAKNKLNLLLTDGRYLYVHTNCANTLYKLQKDGTVFFSTQPLTDENWQKVEFCTPLAFKNGQHIKTGTTHKNEYIENKEALKFLYQIFSDL